ncbi:MAG: class I adenylate-forming enzyme family protein [Promethearchaeota archaeon]
MELGKSKIVIKPSGKGKYKTTWIYIPSKIANDTSFPFNDNEEILIEVQKDSILITKDNTRSRTIRRFGITNITLPKLLEKKAEENGELTFLYFNKDKYSYSDINASANQFAHGIVNTINEMHLKKPKISILMKNSPSYLFLWFGVLKSGCVAVNVNTALREEHLLHILNDSDTEIIVADYQYFKIIQKMLTKLPKIKRIYINNAPSDYKFDDKIHDFRFLLDSNVENPKINIYDEDPIQINYTEGITGPPKGVLYRNLALSAINIGIELMKIGLQKETKIYCPLPLFHGATQFYAIIPSLFYDASIILAENFNVKRFWEEIRIHRPEVFVYFGGYIHALLDNSPNSLDRDHSISYAYGFGASNQLWKSFENRFGITLYEFWSQMEGVGITMNTVGSKGGKIGSVGKPLDFIDLKIVDHFENPLPTGSNNTGEIVVRTNTNYSLEYYKQPETTDVRIGADGWVFTGDYGYVDEEGFLYFMGKANEVIIKAGEKIYLKEIESITNSHPSVFLSTCVPILNKNQSKGELILYAVKRANSSLTPEKLSKYLYHHLAFYHVPRYIAFKDDLPVGPSTEYLKNQMRIEWEKQKQKINVWDNQIQDYLE